MSTLNLTISGSFSTDYDQYSLAQPSASLTMGGEMQFSTLTVTQAASLAVPLGTVTTPTIGYFYNAGPTNYVSILDNATEIARIPSGRAALIPLPNGVDLKAQANTADCSMPYALWEEAP